MTNISKVSGLGVYGNVAVSSKTIHSTIVLLERRWRQALTFTIFSWVTKFKITSLPNKEHQHILLQFLHDDIEYLSGKEVEEAVRYYDKHL